MPLTSMYMWLSMAAKGVDVVEGAADGLVGGAEGGGHRVAVGAGEIDGCKGRVGGGDGGARGGHQGDVGSGDTKR